MTGPQYGAPWREPAVGAYWDASQLGLSGLERLRAEVDGRIPVSPISRLTGHRATQAAVGAATFSMPATPWLLGSSGLIAGGTLAILADAPLAAAIGTSLPPQSGLVTSELSLRFLRPVRVGGELVAHGTLVHAGRSLGLSHVRITDGSGRLLADGSSMCFIRSSSGSGNEIQATEAPKRGSADCSSSRPDPWQRPVLGEVLGKMSGTGLAE